MGNKLRKKNTIEKKKKKKVKMVEPIDKDS